MAHTAVQVLGQLLLILLVPGLPILYFIYSDRFAHLPTPRHFASVFALLVLLGAVIHVPAVSVVGATALLGIGLAWVCARYALSGLTYVHEMHPTRMFPGDRADLVLRIENRKILPLSWLHIVDPIRFRRVRNDRRLEDVLAFSGGVQRLETRDDALINTVAIGPFQSLTRRYTVEALRRGVYEIGPAEAESGDPFGLFNRKSLIAPRLEVVVYPNVYQPDEVAFPFREALGELIPHRALLEDPTLLAGSREYQPGDPLQKMHWKATARTGELQVRINDPSTTANMLVVVNLNTFQYMWQGMDTKRMEATIDAAASLAIWGLDKGYAVGMRANGTAVGTDNATRVPPSAHPQQAGIILDYLARLTHSSRFRPEYVLMDEMQRLDARSSVVFVTPVITSELSAVLTARELKGRVSVVYSGSHAAPVIPGLPLHILVPPERTRAAS